MVEPAIEALEDFMDASLERPKVSPFDEEEVDPLYYHEFSRSSTRANATNRVYINGGGDESGSDIESYYTGEEVCI